MAIRVVTGLRGWRQDNYPRLPMYVFAGFGITSFTACQASRLLVPLVSVSNQAPARSKKQCSATGNSHVPSAIVDVIDGFNLAERTDQGKRNEGE